MVLCGFKSKKAFAEAVGVTPHTISNLLNGLYMPGHALISAIYQTLQLTPQEGTDIFFSVNLRSTKVNEVETGCVK
ncbi:helix-turn-helix transcriptional regulator [Sporosarcina sp. ANT_H38]|nr:helix-turn-helix transcriptional regulator [Sporosarcina sp. ANT_H38]